MYLSQALNNSTLLWGLQVPVDNYIHVPMNIQNPTLLKNLASHYPVPLPSPVQDLPHLSLSLPCPSHCLQPLQPTYC